MFICLGGRVCRRGGIFKWTRAAWKKEVAKNGLAPSTKRGYQAAWGKWIRWCRLAEQELQSVDELAPTIEVLCSFIQYQCILHPVSTVRGYVRRASTVSKDKGGGGLIKKDWTRVINRTYKAAARRFKQVTSKRRPMTVEILKRIKSQLKHESHNDRAIWAILCLGVFTLARIGELLPSGSSKLEVTRRALVIRGDHGVLSLVGTKTDADRKGVQLHFFRNNSVCCPVAAMNAYLTGLTAGATSQALFVDDKGERMTQAKVIDRVRALLDQIGLEGKDFSGISLRRGGAQVLLRLGADEKVIMAMGRWKSACFRRYLTIEESDLAQWQKKMAES